jgi:hypothetical protein
VGNRGISQFDDMRMYSKDNVDATMKVWGELSKGVQAITAETADYSRKWFEEGSAVLQKLLGAQTFENAIEIQTAYAKTACEGFVAQATRMGELFANLSRPLESFVPEAPAARPTENLVPQAPAAKPTENFVPQAPAADFVPQVPVAKPTENFAAKAPIPKAPTTKPPTAKASTTKAPIPKAPTTE